MSEFKGTNGKWNQNRSCVFIGESESVDKNVICRLHRGTFDYMGEEMKANALLISKAPEMLQSLQDVIRLRDLIDYDESIVNESNIGEASALHQMINRIDLLIKEATEI